MPDSVRPAMRRLSRRLALGLFVEIWPVWAIGSLLVAGIVALVCRLFFPGAAGTLRWLWVAPLCATLVALLLCRARRYRPAELVALADSLAGGRGLLLALHERDDEAWRRSALFESSSHFELPALRLGRLGAVIPAIAFLAAVLWLPQRMPTQAAALADGIAADLTTAVVELKQEQLITPEEERKLEEEIERIRRATEERVDAGSWEAADALRERMAAQLSAKQDAATWAEEALARYSAAAAASDGTGAGDPGKDASADELKRAVEKLAQSGLLENAPADLKALLNGGTFPTDRASLQRLAESLGMCLSDAKGRLGSVAQGRFGRFDPSEFKQDRSERAAGPPGSGGITRGRADAELTWGQESQPHDRFKSSPLPPGAPRTPDDWAPVVMLPGSPNAAPQLSGPSSGRQYAASAGQAAWRRTLAPRHQSAVKKYFDAPAESKKR